jgi:hypothetical protein
MISYAILDTMLSILCPSSFSWDYPPPPLLAFAPRSLIDEGSRPALPPPTFAPLLPRNTLQANRRDDMSYRFTSANIYTDYLAFQSHAWETGAQL